MERYLIGYAGSFAGFMAAGYSGNQIIAHLIALPAACMAVWATDYYWRKDEDQEDVG